MRRLAMRSAVGLAVLLLAFGGCVRLRRPAAEIQDYDLGYSPPAIAGEPLDVAIGVPNLGITAAYDREVIVYRTGAHQLGRYFYHRWATNPSDMIADLLARDFAQSGLYRAVLHRRSLLATDYQLTGEIETIEERTLADGCAAVLAIRFLLVRNSPSGELVVSRPHFEEARPCGCNQPAELVAALSDALSAISAELQRQVYGAIAAEATSAR